MLLFPLLPGFVVVFVLAVVVQTFACDVVVAKLYTVVCGLCPGLCGLELLKVVVYVHELAVPSCSAVSFDVESACFWDSVSWMCFVTLCCVSWAVCWC